MADIKLQFVLGQEANTDQRGTPAGKEQGDFHRTLEEWRVPDNDPEIAAMLPLLEEANQQSIAGASFLFSTLEEVGLLDEALGVASALLQEDVSGSKFAAFLIRIYDND